MILRFLANKSLLKKTLLFLIFVSAHYSFANPAIVEVNFARWPNGKKDFQIKRYPNFPGGRTIALSMNLVWRNFIPQSHGLGYNLQGSKSFQLSSPQTPINCTAHTKGPFQPQGFLGTSLNTKNPLTIAFYGSACDYIIEDLEHELLTIEFFDVPSLSKPEVIYPKVTVQLTELI